MNLSELLYALVTGVVNVVCVFGLAFIMAVAMTWLLFAEYDGVLPEGWIIALLPLTLLIGLGAAWSIAARQTRRPERRHQ